MYLYFKKSMKVAFSNTYSLALLFSLSLSLSVSRSLSLSLFLSLTHPTAQAFYPVRDVPLLVTQAADNQVRWRVWSDEAIAAANMFIVISFS